MRERARKVILHSSKLKFLLRRLTQVYSVVIAQILKCPSKKAAEWQCVADAIIALNLRESDRGQILKENNFKKWSNITVEATTALFCENKFS